MVIEFYFFINMSLQQKIIMKINCPALVKKWITVKK